MYENVAQEADLHGDYIVEEIVSAEWDGNTLMWLLNETLESLSDYFWKHINQTQIKELAKDLYW